MIRVAKYTLNRLYMSRVGQNHLYTLVIQYFWQGDYHMCTVMHSVYIRFWPTLYMSYYHISNVIPPLLYA